MVTFSLEKVSRAVRATPDAVTEFKIKKQEKKKQPQNAISGVYKGTTIFVKSVFDGVSGVVIKPVKGAKEKGVKGATVGIGKGIMGLVCKPIAGGIDMLTNTVRGIGNTPKSLYKGTKKYFKKDLNGMNNGRKFAPIRPYIPGESDTKEIEEFFIGSNEEGEIFVDRKELKKLMRDRGYKDSEEGLKLYKQVRQKVNFPTQDLLKVINELIISDVKNFLTV